MIASLLITLLFVAPGASFAQETPPVPEAKAVPTPAEQALAALKAGKYEEAAKILEPALEKGDAPAETLKGLMYLHGAGVPQDNAQAVEWFKKAAEKNNPVAQYNLGHIYNSSWGKSANLSIEDAMKWYDKAAAQKYPPALYELGLVYYNKNDKTKAKELFEAAASPNGKYPPHPRAMRELAELYVTIDPSGPEPSDQDQAKAVEWMTKAAEHGDDWAQYSIAEWYRYGYNGLAQDPERAYMWLSLVLKNPNASPEFKGTSYASMEEIVGSLTPEQLQRAKEKAQKISAKYAPPAK